MYERCPVCNSPLDSADAACSACGFKISGSTQRMQPIVLDAEKNVTPIERPAQKATFTVVRGEQLNTRYELDNRPMTIGRAPSNDIFLNDMTVSSTHAQTYFDTGNFYIKDLGSFNGVWINNENITQSILHDGDIVQVGVFCLLFQQ